MEIKRVVWSCDSDKSPGPDGFNFGSLSFVGRRLRLTSLELFVILRMTEDDQGGQIPLLFL